MNENNLSDTNNIENIIQTIDLSVWYHHLHALKSIDFGIHKNSVTALIGASGSGKSTFLRALNRMHDTVPTARIDGQILFNGSNVMDSDTDVIDLRRRVGMVFQNPTPFPKSIYDNIAYGLEIQGLKNRHKKIFGNKKINPAKIEASDDPIDKVVVSSLKEAALWDEVKDRLHHSAFRLSGGQQQRLCIARAIAIRPQVLLLDEPCSDLDPISTKKIEDLLLKLKENYTIVIVTHNLRQAKRVADYVGFFHLGDLIEFGTTAQVFDTPTQELTRNYVRGDFG